MLRVLRQCEEYCHHLAERHFPSHAPFLRRHARVWRYLISGGAAAVTDLGLLYLLTDGAGLHYLVSATFAFVVAFIVSFLLQKFWTFGDATRDRVHAQLVIYLAIALVNVGVNAGLMYLLVDIAGLWYLFAQILVGAAIACYSFIIYPRLVFNSLTHNR